MRVGGMVLDPCVTGIQESSVVCGKGCLVGTSLRPTFVANACYFHNSCHVKAVPYFRPLVRVFTTPGYVQPFY